MTCCSWVVCWNGAFDVSSPLDFLINSIITGTVLSDPCMYVVPQHPRSPRLRRRAACPTLTPAQTPRMQLCPAPSRPSLTRIHNLPPLRATRAGSALRWQSRNGQVLGELERSSDPCSLRCPSVCSISSLHQLIPPLHTLVLGSASISICLLVAAGCC